MPRYLTAEQKHDAIRDNLALARHWAGRLATDYDTRGELGQVGALALAEAAERYDLDLAPLSHFGRFAGKYVQGRMRRWLARRAREKQAELAALPPSEGERDDRLVSGEIRNGVQRAMTFLSDEARDVMRDRFGLDGGRPVGWAELGRRYNMTVAEARRVVDESALTILDIMIRDGWAGYLAYANLLPVLRFPVPWPTRRDMGAA